MNSRRATPKDKISVHNGDVKKNFELQYHVADPEIDDGLTVAEKCTGIPSDAVAKQSSDLKIEKPKEHGNCDTDSEEVMQAMQSAENPLDSSSPAVKTSHRVSLGSSASEGEKAMNFDGPKASAMESLSNEKDDLELEDNPGKTEKAAGVVSADCSEGLLEDSDTNDDVEASEEDHPSRHMKPAKEERRPRKASLFNSFSYDRNNGNHEDNTRGQQDRPRRAAARAVVGSFNEDAIEKRLWGADDADEIDKENRQTSRKHVVSLSSTRQKGGQAAVTMARPIDRGSIDDAAEEFDSDMENRPPPRRSTRRTRLTRKIVDLSSSSEDESDDDETDRSQSQHEIDDRGESGFSSDESSDQEADTMACNEFNGGIVPDEYKAIHDLSDCEAAARVDKILARRLMQKPMSQMRSESRDGSEGNDSGSSVDFQKEDTAHNNVEYRIKIKGKSYREAKWVTRDALLLGGRIALVRSFEKRFAEGIIDPYGDLEDGIHPDWLTIDRIIAHHDGFQASHRRYLVKWRSLNYSECTWEPKHVLMSSEEDARSLERYEAFAAAYTDLLSVDRDSTSPSPQVRHHENEPKALPDSKAADQENGNTEGHPQHNDDDTDDDKFDVALDLSNIPSFCNGRELRDYQKESLKWMVSNWASGRNCILGDEMGLGKTAQSIAVMAYQRQLGGVTGPFLVVAPLTTLGHWQREIEVWTTMNCVVYSGNARDRDIIRRYELWPEGTNESGARSHRRSIKPDVVLSSYEMVLRDASVFQSIPWETLIIDEAHRMKGTTSSTRNAIVDCTYGWLLLLSGTPVQNNMRELFGLLNLLDPEKYDDEDGFLATFGDDTNGKGSITPEQVKSLQQALRPVLLRRMKEDVETLPEKEECIIWTQLTAEQRQYYRAIFERRIGDLMVGGKARNAPQLRNIAMELRKVCCHPFLCDGIEEDYRRRRRLEDDGEEEKEGSKANSVDVLVQSSGKMLLLHKLLPKLRTEGHKVLIFSQFKIMLDVLEDYLRAAEFPCERIDGSTSSRDRQAAIDRFSRPDSDGFVFLLSTRAGGQGITLTAADTCIIYDSDWNPQNDLQAMARCHRIGQCKDVTIYRLVSKNTYEEHVFRTSSRKYGLDEAILGGICTAGAKSDPEADTARLAELLKHGAMALAAAASENAAKDTEDFASEDIDDILKGRTEKRIVGGGRAGNTFSVATFEVSGSDGSEIPSKENGDDASFWSTLLPEAAAAEAERKKAPPAVILVPRRRKRINYAENVSRRKKSRMDESGQRGRKRSRDLGDVDSDDVDGDVSDSDVTYGEKEAAPACRGRSVSIWLPSHVDKFLDQLLRYGFWRYTLASEKAGLRSVLCKEEELKGIAVALEKFLEVAAERTPMRPAVNTTSKPFSKQGGIASTLRMAVKDGSVDGPASQTPGVSTDGDKEERTSKSLEYEAQVLGVLERMPLEELPEASKHLASTTMSAVKSPDVLRRIVRNAIPYRNHALAMEELRNIFGDAAEGVEQLNHPLGFRTPKVGVTSKTLLHQGWQALQHDLALLKACYTVGYPCPGSRKMKEETDNILRDRRFGFHKLFLHPDDGDEHHVVTEHSEGEGGARDIVPGMGTDGDGLLRSAAATSHVHSLSMLTPRVLEPEKWARARKETTDRIKALLSGLVKRRHRAILDGERYDTVAHEICHGPIDDTLANGKRSGLHDVKPSIFGAKPVQRMGEAKESKEDKIEICLVDVDDSGQLADEKKRNEMRPSRIGSPSDANNEALLAPPIAGESHVQSMMDNRNPLEHVVKSPSKRTGLVSSCVSHLDREFEKLQQKDAGSSIVGSSLAKLTGTTSSVGVPGKLSGHPVSFYRSKKESKKHAGQRSLLDMMKFGLKSSSTKMAMDSETENVPPKIECDTTVIVSSAGN